MFYGTQINSHPKLNNMQIKGRFRWKYNKIQIASHRDGSRWLHWVRLIPLLTPGSAGEARIYGWMKHIIQRDFKMAAAEELYTECPWPRLYGLKWLFACLSVHLTFSLSVCLHVSVCLCDFFMPKRQSQK